MCVCVLCWGEQEQEVTGGDRRRRQDTGARGVEGAHSLRAAAGAAAWAGEGGRITSSSDCPPSGLWEAAKGQWKVKERAMKAR